MKLIDIQRRLGCSIHLAADVQAILAEERTNSQTARILCRSALAELSNAIAFENVDHPAIEAAAEHLRNTLAMM